jgi:TolA-binding protein
MKREDEAATVAELVIRKYANHPAATGALLAVADAQRQAQKFSAAVEMYQKVLAGTPDARTAAAAHAGLALCYASGQAPDIERANRELDSMTDDGSQPGYRARIRYMVALDYERAQRLAEAYQQYQAALGAQPGEEIGALAALRSGIVLVAQGKRTESIAAFQVVIQTYPKAIVVPDALYEMAWGFIDSGRKSDAAPLFERLEKEFPEHPFGVDASFRLAEDDFGQKRYAQAAERYQRVAQSPQAGPLADKSLYKLGWCQREMKDMVASGRAFATLLSRYEKSALAPESKLRLAEALIAQGDNSRAAGLLAELLGRKAADDIERRLEAQARVALAGIQLGQGDPGAAYQTAQPAASTQFQSVGMRAQLLCAEARFAQKQYREALTDYLKVITIYPRVDDLTGQALYRVGECSDQLGQRDQAAEYWREVVKSYPGTEWARRAGERLGK